MYQLTLLYKLVLTSVLHDFRQYEAQLGVGPDTFSVDCRLGAALVNKR